MFFFRSQLFNSPCMSARHVQTLRLRKCPRQFKNKLFLVWWWWEGVLWSEEIRESLFWPGLVTRAGRGRVSSARTQLLLARPARPLWPLGARAPCLRGRAPAPGGCWECGVWPHSVSGSVSVLSTWCGRAHHITVSITGHESDISRLPPAQSYHHQQPGASQVCTVCYEQVKAEHISQWVPGNQGSDHTRTKTKLAITFAQLARKPQNVDAQHRGLSPAHRDVPRGVECGQLPRHLHRAHHHLHHPGQCQGDDGSSQRHKCELSSAQHPARARGGSLHVPATQAAPAQSCTGFLISGKCFK